MSRSDVFRQNAELGAYDWFVKNRPSTIFLRKNYRFRGGEIDLIFEEKCEASSVVTLVFIEVRAGRRGSQVTPLESLNYKKRQKIRLTSRHFLTRYKGPATQIRFDLLAWDGEIFDYFSDLDL
jgi:Holliday junction resolvase-like predicted endonuclease